MKTIKTGYGAILKAAELTKVQVALIGIVHPNVSITDYSDNDDLDEWGIPTGYTLISIDAVGDEPLGDILADLRSIGYDIATQGQPTDTGYDTDVDGNGINSVFAVFKK